MTATRSAPEFTKADYPTITNRETIFRYQSSRSVVKAEWHGKTIAIKHYFFLYAFSDQGGSTPEAMKAAHQRECNVLKMLKGADVTNVIGYFGSGVFGGSTGYLVMPFMPNGSLIDYVLNDKNPRFDWAVRIKGMYGIASAVAYLHEHDYIHRDIKSGNVYLDEDFTFRLADFDSTSKVDEVGRYVSTPLFMAPELWQDEPFSKATDVYAFAVLMWVVSAWRDVFVEVKTESELKKLVLDDKRETIPPDCPARVASLITLGWAQKPEKRPTMNEISDKLNDIKLTS